MSDERPVVICASWSLRTMALVPGNVEGRCGECKGRIVIGPASRRIGPITVLCWPCAQRLHPLARTTLTKDVEEELRAYGGQDLVDESRAIDGVPFVELGDEEPLG